MAGEFAVLKDLFNDWNVGVLFEYFKAQDINVAELKIMKTHHIEAALHNFPLGVRIRFEHYLEQWRHAAFKPLQENCANNHNNSSNSNNNNKCCSCACASFRDWTINQTHATSSEPTPTPTVTPIPTPPMPTEPEVITTEMDAEADSDLLCEFMDREPQLSNSELLANVEEEGDMEFLLKILHSSGVKGTALLDYRQHNAELQPEQRTLLINLIVQYFEDREQHLPLNLSHHLERGILKLFPKEKLRNYRTEKRGKIYIKYTNMKRYKREKPPKRRRTDNCCLPTSSSAVPVATLLNNDENGLTTNWHENLLSDGKIKIETNID